MKIIDATIVENKGTLQETVNARKTKEILPLPGVKMIMKKNGIFMHHLQLKKKLAWLSVSHQVLKR
jgi:hypothetical protein